MDGGEGVGSARDEQLHDGHVELLGVGTLERRAQPDLAAVRRARRVVALPLVVHEEKVRVVGVEVGERPLGPLARVERHRHAAPAQVDQPRRPAAPLVKTT